MVLDYLGHHETRHFHTQKKLRHLDNFDLWVPMANQVKFLKNVTNLELHASLKNLPWPVEICA
jgi:hypothetical protein